MTSSGGFTVGFEIPQVDDFFIFIFIFSYEKIAPFLCFMVCNYLVHVQKVYFLFNFAVST